MSQNQQINGGNDGVEQGDSVHQQPGVGCGADEVPVEKAHQIMQLIHEFKVNVYCYKN